MMLAARLQVIVDFQGVNKSLTAAGDAFWSICDVVGDKSPFPTGTVAVRFVGHDGMGEDRLGPYLCVGTSLR